jgi:uncharacterized protein (DUF1778 family)
MARPAAAKTCRIDLRVTREQKSFIKRVAGAQGQKISDFVLNSAREKAEMILADQREFSLPPKQWASFVAVLDRPVNHHERLARLMTEPSVLERE